MSRGIQYAAGGMLGWCAIELGLRAATGLLGGGWSAAGAGLVAGLVLGAARRG